MCVKPRSQNELDCLAKIETLTARIEAGEVLSTLYLERAHQYKQVAHLDEAIADLTTALEIDPPLTVVEQADAYNLRGIAYRRQARFTEAIVDATTSIRLMPERASYWADRGWACVCGGLTEQGMKDLNHSLEMEPYFLAMIYRGIAQFIQGNYNAALADYDNVIELYGDNIAYNSFLNRGVLRLMMQFDLAAIEADFDVAVQRIHDSFTPNGRPYAYRALVRAMRSNVSGAEADLHEAEHLGGDPILPLVRGWIGKSNNQPATLRAEISNFVFEICPVIGLSTESGLQLAARFIENPGSALPSLMPVMV
jgi:tetratricopeptide (TPR) repeat protein